MDKSVTVCGVRLHVQESGSGPLVVLLHGFPEFSYEWRRQVPALADAGFRVVVPDQRGYATSDKPPRRADYRVEELAGDVAALIKECGADRAAVVGHDWGGIVAYYTAMLHPECVDKLIILNAPHPALFERVLRRNPRQLRRSWYAVFFMLPLIPETILRSFNWYGFRRVFKRDAVPGAFTAQDIERYVEAWSQPGAITAMINWYRALAYRRPSTLRPLWRPIEAPTLVLWGDRDRHLLPRLADPEAKWVPSVEVKRFPDASHWLPHDEPDRVNEALIQFLKS